MKISKNVAVFAGGEVQNQKKAEEQEKQAQKDAKSLYAGSLNEDIFANRLQQKKKEAQQKAMKVITDAWEGDRAIDEDLQSRREHVEELTQANKELQKKISDISGEQQNLQETYGVAADSQEQQDLELVRKARNLMTKGSLSREELMRVASIEKNGLTEYQQRQLELDDAKGVYQEELSENEKTILEENAIIRGTRLERLKYSPMVTARNQADEIMEAASGEIIGMVMEDAKEHIDEEQEKRQEQADKLEEQRKEQEKFIESQKEKREEEKDLLEDMPIEEMLQLKQVGDEVQQEVQKILSKMKLVAEDIKGAAVDESL